LKHYYIESLGCAKNQVDSEYIMAELEAEGYIRAEQADDANLIVINTCAFIESAKRESINTILSFRQLYPGKKISVRGCLAERYKKELEESLPEADEFRGVPDFASQERDQTQPGARPLLSLAGSAYVKISEGCNNRCSFCAIPRIRGPLKSRSIESITGECRQLLKRGIKELVLIAQDAGSYGRDTGNHDTPQLPALLRAIAAIKQNAEDGAPPDFWVRLLYIHPDQLLPGRDPASDHLLEDLITVIRDNPPILPYFDLPFQHAAPSILRAMGRKGNRDAYLNIISQLRENLPGAVIRSTFLVGFPGETSNDFAELLAFQQAAQIDWLGVFTYSREEDTAAYTMKNRVPKRAAALRKAALEEAQIPITTARLATFTGIKTQALIEEEVDSGNDIHDGTEEPDAETIPNPHLYIGRLPIHAPEVDGAAVIESDHPLPPGSFAQVTTIGTAGVDMRCRHLPRNRAIETT
jgi:ribosomal protein S12 methylthiotransferase